MKLNGPVLAVALASLALAACAQTPTGGALPAWAGFTDEGCPNATSDRETAAVNQVLDALHAAAARADGETYFSLYHPFARFLGTDETESWSLETFRDYAEPHFRAGRGWKYTAEARTVAVRGRACDWAWFDEQLASESYGRARGSGVLVKTPGGWKVEHYVLSFPIPNDLAKGITAQIREHAAKAPPR